jgi:hypothetical protein
VPDARQPFANIQTEFSRTESALFSLKARSDCIAHFRVLRRLRFDHAEIGEYLAGLAVLSSVNSMGQRDEWGLIERSVSRRAASPSGAARFKPHLVAMIVAQQRTAAESAERWRSAAGHLDTPKR